MLLRRLEPRAKRKASETTFGDELSFSQLMQSRKHPGQEATSKEWELVVLGEGDVVPSRSVSLPHLPASVGLVETQDEAPENQAGTPRGSPHSAAFARTSYGFC